MRGKLRAARRQGFVIALLTFSVAALSGAVADDYAAGIEYLKAGRPAEALPLLEMARQRTPRDPDLLYNLAGCYFALARKDDGIRVALDLAGQNRSDPAILLAAGTLLAGYDAPDRAVPLLAEADALKPGNPMVLNALARAQSLAGQSGDAAASLEKLLANLRSASAPETKSVLEQARQTALSLHRKDSASLRTGLLAAEFALLADRPADALEILQPIEKLAAGNADFYKLLGLALSRLERYPAAVRAGQRALQLAPRRQDLLLNLAAIYQKSRDNQASIRLLQRAVQRGTVSPEIYFALALSQFNFGSYGDAVRTCDRALALDPAFDRAVLLKGRAYDRLARPQDAIASLSRAARMNPACVFCRYELARILAAAGRPDEAEPLLREIVKVDPANALAQFQLGKLLEARGDGNGAIAALSACVAADPNHDSAWYLLGRVYLRNGNPAQAQRAMAEVKRIKAQRRDDAEAHLTTAPRQSPQ